MATHWSEKAITLYRSEQSGFVRASGDYLSIITGDFANVGRKRNVRSIVPVNLERSSVGKPETFFSVGPRRAVRSGREGLGFISG
jgi:hypothetical protein